MKHILVLLMGIVTTVAGLAQLPSNGSASIVGRVSDETETSYPTEVQVFQIVVRQGIGDVNLKCQTLTQSEGRFECPNLPEGRYLVQARPLLAPVAANTRESEAIPSSVFYPNVTDLDLATIVSLKNGEEKWTDFQLVKVPVVDIAGVLDNHPRGAVITLKSESSGRELDIGVHLRYDSTTGQFNAAHVPAGHYLLAAKCFIGSTEYKAVLPVVVGNSPLRDLRLTALSSAEVTGRLLNLPANYSIYQVRLVRVDGSSRNITTTVTNGAFHFQSVPPGEYILALPSNQSVYVDSLLVGGTSISGPKFSLGSGTVTVDAEFKGPALKIQGLVKQWENVALHAEVIALDEQTGQIYETVTDSERRFALTGLAPGAYRLYAWPGVDIVEYRNPNILKRYDQDSTSVSIEEGSVSSPVELDPISKGW